MIYYIVGVVSALQKDAREVHEKMKETFPNQHVFIYIPDDEGTGIMTSRSVMGRSMLPTKKTASLKDWGTNAQP